MNYLSKAASHSRVAGGFATVLVVGTFLGALALAGSGENAAPFDSSILDSNGLMIAMSLETSPEPAANRDDGENELPFTSGLEQTPEQQRAATPACSWDGSDAAAPCMIDWPYQDARVAQAAATPCYDDFGDVVDCRDDAPLRETLVANSTSNVKAGPVVCGEEINDDDSLECLNSN